MNENFPSHDDFIRSILSDKKIAIAYFKNFLPEFVRERLDFSTLQQLPDSYLSDELKKSISDIVYSCTLKDSNGNLKISLLIEHKSHQDKFTPVQIGSYIFSALQKQVQNKESLSIVIPVLIYHGKTRWQYRTLESLFENMESQWKQFIPNFEFIYNNLGVLSDSEIESLNNKFLAASFLALKHSHEKEWIEQNAGHLLLLAAEGTKGLRKGFIIYLYRRGKIEENILNSLPETLKKDVMNTLDMYIEKGRKEGIEKGRKEGILEGIEKGKEEVVRNLLKTNKYTVSQIAGLACVPDSFVKKIKSATNKSI